jgi:prevent-host-death family protein
METINIHQAKTHLSRLLERVAAGEDIVIAKSGKPIARLTQLVDGPSSTMKRIGFMEGEFEVPEDFDSMGAEEILAMFEGEA